MLLMEDVRHKEVQHCFEELAEESNETITSRWQLYLDACAVWEEDPQLFTQAAQYLAISMRPRWTMLCHFVLQGCCDYTRKFGSWTGAEEQLTPTHTRLIKWRPKHILKLDAFHIQWRVEPYSGNEAQSDTSTGTRVHHWMLKQCKCRPHFSL